MKEALKRGAKSKGKPMDLSAEDNDPNKLTEHAPSLAADAGPEVVVDDGGIMDGLPQEGLPQEGETVPVPKELLEKILQALMGVGDHTGRSAMTLNERAKEGMLKKQEKLV